MITGVGSVWFLVPEGVDDPARVSGGNVFDQRVRDELTRRDWTVRMVPIGPDAAVADALAVGGEAGGERVEAETLGELDPQALAAAGELDHAVGAGEQAVGADRRVVVATGTD